MCIQKHLMSKFSIHKDQVPVTRIDVSCVGRCYVVHNLQFYKTYAHILAHINDYKQNARNEQH
jgi:hypothetical protein